MIERQYGKVIFICDVEKSPKCEGQIETGEADFHEALAAFRAEGWQVYPPQRPGLEFTHVCPNCPIPR